MSEKDLKQVLEEWDSHSLTREIEDCLVKLSTYLELVIIILWYNQSAPLCDFLQHKYLFSNRE